MTSQNKRKVCNFKSPYDALRGIVPARGCPIPAGVRGLGSSDSARQGGLPRAAGPGPSPASRIRLLALVAALLIAPLTACSLNANGQAPVAPTDSQSRETDKPSSAPTGEASSPDGTGSPDKSGEPSASSSGSANEANLCGGLLSERFLKDELSFTPAPDKQSFKNQPPSDSSYAATSCTLYDKNDGTLLAFIYGDSTLVSKKEMFHKWAQEAEANADGRWRPLSVTGQEGKGWTRVSLTTHRVIWTYPDGSMLAAAIIGDEHARDVTTDHLESLGRQLVSNVREHNMNAGVVNEGQS